MAMVDRYKKSGGFIQLLQVIETCGPKKRDQFIGIITEETPQWAEAIKNKMLSFDKIISWRPEAVLEIMAQVNPLAFVTALKSLSPDQYKAFCEKLSPQERRKVEQQFNEITPDPNQVSSCVMKVVSETRILFTTNKLKFDKIDPELAIPEEYESIIESGGSPSAATLSSLKGMSTANIDVTPTPVNVSGDTEQLRKKVVELTQQINSLKKDNLIMRDKLEKIKKIA